MGRIVRPGIQGVEEPAPPQLKTAPKPWGARLVFQFDMGHADCEITPQQVIEVLGRAVNEMIMKMRIIKKNAAAGTAAESTPPNGQSEAKVDPSKTGDQIAKHAGVMMDGIEEAEKPASREEEIADLADRLMEEPFGDGVEPEASDG